MNVPNLTATQKAYRLRGLIRATRLAVENESEGDIAPIDTGSREVLEVAEELAAQIIDDCERLEGFIK